MAHVEDSRNVTTYGGSNSGRSNVSLVYDPVKRQWVESAPTNSNSSATGGASPTKTETAKSTNSETPVSKVNSKKSADKDYIEIEFNTLQGDLQVTATEKSMKIKVNDTIKLEGLGSNLSGLYFVSEVKRSVSKDGGYSHSFTVIKTGFGGSLKKSQSEGEKPRKDEVKKEVKEIDKGDKVRIVGDSAVYSNAHDGVKIPKWVKEKQLTVQSISSDGTRVLLQPINSWTYIKFVKKV